MINLFWLVLKGAPHTAVDVDTDATAVISS
jgi:hypothetical protein